MMQAHTSLGWECPVCHRGVAPWTTECSHGKLQATNFTGTQPYVVELQPAPGMWKCSCGQWHEPGYVCVLCNQQGPGGAYPK